MKTECARARASSREGVGFKLALSRYQLSVVYPYCGVAAYLCIGYKKRCTCKRGEEEGGGEKQGQL